jgi:hypothetical protein
MKSVLKVLILLFILSVAAYFISFYIMPSVTVKNLTNVNIQSANVSLPNSGLNFGPIGAQRTNTIHYSLKQSDGVYQYRFTLDNGLVALGECGYVTNNEIHKRMEISITEGATVVCKSGT